MNPGLRQSRTLSHHEHLEDSHGVVNHTERLMSQSNEK
jgi:hypothetical protein